MTTNVYRHLSVFAILGLLTCCRSAPQPRVDDWHNKGVELLESKKYSEALRYFEMVQEHKPDDAALCYDRAKCLYYLKRYDEAIDAFDQAIERDQGHSAAWLGKAIALYKVGEYAEAKEAAGWAKDLGHSRAGHYLEKIETKLASLRTKEAIKSERPAYSKEDADREGARSGSEDTNGRLGVSTFTRLFRYRL